MNKSLVFAICTGFLLAACNTGTDAPYNQTDFAQGGADAPLYN